MPWQLIQDQFQDRALWRQSWTDFTHYQNKNVKYVQYVQHEVLMQYIKTNGIYIVFINYSIIWAAWRRSGGAMLPHIKKSSGFELAG